MIIGIIMGILAGFIACKITNRKGKGCLMNLILGIAGGFVGGMLADVLGIYTTNWVGELATSTVGAVVVLWLWNKVF